MDLFSFSVFFFLFSSFSSFSSWTNDEWTNDAKFLNCDENQHIKKDMINCMYNIISKLDNFKRNILEHSKCTKCDYVLISL